MLTVETEGNGDSKSMNDRGPSLIGSLGLSCRYNIFFLTVHYFNAFVPIA
jgi:hypothetical protein